MASEIKKESKKKYPRNHSYQHRTVYDYEFNLNLKESVRINDSVWIKYIDGLNEYGRQVKLGIEAPNQVSILRLELFARNHQLYDHEVVLNLKETLYIGDSIQLTWSYDVRNRVFRAYINAPRSVKVQKALFTTLKADVPVFTQESTKVLLEETV